MSLVFIVIKPISVYSGLRTSSLSAAVKVNKVLNVITFIYWSESLICKIMEKMQELQLTKTVYWNLKQTIKGIIVSTWIISGVKSKICSMFSVVLNVTTDNSVTSLALYKSIELAVSKCSNELIQYCAKVLGHR